MLNANGVSEKEFLEYKGKPLVRQGNDIYFGDLAEPYHIYMMIMSRKDSVQNGETVPDKIMVQLLKNDRPTPEKQTVARGLNDAFETAEAWLDRYNK